jgi:hypothetical protein
VTVSPVDAPPRSESELGPVTPTRNAASSWLTATRVMAVGLLLVAVADVLGRAGKSVASGWYWAGIVVLVVTATTAVTRRHATRSERQIVVMCLGAAFYLLKVMHSPTYFTFVDEHQLLRSFIDVGQTHRLFHLNPLVQAYSRFPGLVEMTSSLATLSGASYHTAGLIVIGGTRLLLMAALFLVLEHATGSDQLAAIATVLYAGNTNFVYFNAEVGYESLALPLAVVVLLVVCRREEDGGGSVRPRGVAAPLLIVAVVVTHHMTALWLVMFLLVWAAVTKLTGMRGRTNAPLPPAVIATVCATLWFVFVARDATVHELGPVVTDAYTSLLHVFTAQVSAKRPFAGGAGPTDPLLERLVGYASVLVLLGSLVVGLVLVVRQRPMRALLVPLSMLACLYPVSLVLRLTQASTETANRSSEFIFFGLCLLTAMAWQWGARRFLRSGGLVETLSVAAGSCVIVAGGIIVGWPPYARLPGGFQASALSRSIDKQGLLAARWAAAELPAHSRIVADSSTRILMGSYAQLDPQLGVSEGVPVARVFFEASFSPVARGIIEADKIRYVVTDDRLTRLLPSNGVYFEGNEPDAGRHLTPLPSVSLNKFATAPGVMRILDGGDVKVYDMTALLPAGTGMDP